MEPDNQSTPNSGSSEWVLAESRLNKLACRALEVRTDKTARYLLKRLIAEAHYSMDLVAEVEGTNDPLTVARNMLEHAIIDEQVILEVNPKFIADPNNVYGQQLALRQAQYPARMEMFEKLVLNSSVESIWREVLVNFFIEKNGTEPSFDVLQQK